MLDPERALALAYVPARHRPAVRALWHLDATLGGVLASTREPMIRQIKLAWWRDALEKLDAAPAPAEPVLGALQSQVIPAGISGVELAGLEEGWRMLLAESLDQAVLGRYAAARGALLFQFTASLLEAGAPEARLGEGWALADLARKTSNVHERDAALAAARERLRDRHMQAKPALRPLTMLARLARRDAGSGLPFEPQGSPRRAAAMFFHRLTGR